MSLIIDIALVLIVVFFAWRGFRNGFIRGIFGILAIIIAIYGANLVAKAYSGDFKGMLEPFVSGIVDKAVTDVTHPGGASDSSEDTSAANSSPKDTSASNTSAADTSADVTPKAGSTDTTRKEMSVYDTSFSALRKIGISEGAARQIAETVGGKIDTVSQQLSSNLTSTLCSALAYIAVFAVAFILIAIIFAVIGNIFNLAFSIPGIESVDKLIGLGMGILKGLLIVLVIAVVIRYLGLMAPETIEKTTVLKYILNMNPLANILGI